MRSTNDTEQSRFDPIVVAPPRSSDALRSTLRSAYRCETKYSHEIDRLMNALDRIPSQRS